MNKASVTVKTVLVLILAAFLLISCGPSEYNGFKIVKQDGERCVQLPYPAPSSESSTILVPLTYYQVSEACIKEVVELYNSFNINADETLSSYEKLATRLASWDSAVIPEKSQKSFGKWFSANSGQNVTAAKPFAEKYCESVEVLVDVLRHLGKQDPLLNTAFTAEEFFNANGRTREVKAAGTFIEQCFPGVKIISEFSERTPFVINEADYIDFPVAAVINKEGEASLRPADSSGLPTFKMPVLFYDKLHSIAQTLVKNYNAFSETDRQTVTELFESCSAVHSLTYNLLDFFPTDGSKAVLLDWLRYIVSLDREDALLVTGGLASFCRAQWLYSYEIISVLDDINWNCSYYENKEEAVKKTWNDYVYKNQNLIDAFAFYENTFPDIAFIKNLDLKIQ